MGKGFIERLNHLSRPARVILCGVVVAMTMPILSILGLGVIPLVVIGVGLYVLGWLFWVGFDVALPPVRTGAILHLFIGIAALLLWALYHLVLLVLLIPS